LVEELNKEKEFLEDRIKKIKQAFLNADKDVPEI